MMKMNGLKIINYWTVIIIIKYKYLKELIF